jgi:hypothetical protein
MANIQSDFPRFRVLQIKFSKVKMVYFHNYLCAKKDMTDIRKERNARNIVALDLNARDMFVHAFDGEDYVCVDYDSEFESVFRANKFVENDVKSSLHKVLSNTKKRKRFELPSG